MRLLDACPNALLLTFALVVLILFIYILLVLSLFNGVFFHIPNNMSSLIVYVVDFDGQVAPYQGGTPLVGPMIVQTTEQIARSDGPHLGYITMPPSHFDNDPMVVRKAVYDFKAHAAIIVNANATALLRQAVDQGNTTYDPNGAAQIIYVSARDQNTIPTYVVPQLTAFEKVATAQFGIQWARTITQNSSISLPTLQKGPQALSPAIGFTTIDLRPFGPANITPAVSISLIYLIIIAFFSFTFFLPIHLKYISPRGHPPLHFHQLIIWRWFATTAAYFFLSLGYSFVSLAFQVPFSNGPASPTEPAINPSAYGKATFVVYWMVNFLGMCALGLSCENVAMALGQPWTAMWLIFWVISNVSTGFYSLDLTPAFYKWGYAWPLHNGTFLSPYSTLTPSTPSRLPYLRRRSKSDLHDTALTNPPPPPVVEASHQLLFDLHSRIGLNLAILLIWTLINTILFAPACYLMRWEQQNAARKAKEKEKEWLTAMSRQRTRVGFAK